jgi:hypothetical protein
MKIVICLVLLDCLLPSPGIAGESRSMWRDRIIFCRQFVISETDAAIIRSTNVDCWHIGNLIHECVVHDCDE